MIIQINQTRIQLLPFPVLMNRKSYLQPSLYAHSSSLFKSLSESVACVMRNLTLNLLILQRGNQASLNSISNKARVESRYPTIIPTNAPKQLSHVKSGESKPLSSVQSQDKNSKKRKLSREDQNEPRKKKKVSNVPIGFSEIPSLGLRNLIYL